MDTLKLRGMELLTTKQAAEVIGVSRRRIQQLCNVGKLGINVGNSYMIAREEIVKYLASPPKRGRPSFRDAAGAIPHWENGEKPEDVISRLRGGKS